MSESHPSKRQKTCNQDGVVHVIQPTTAVDPPSVFCIFDHLIPELLATVLSYISLNFKLCNFSMLNRAINQSMQLDIIYRQDCLDLELPHESYNATKDVYRSLLRVMNAVNRICLVVYDDANNSSSDEAEEDDDQQHESDDRNDDHERDVAIIAEANRLVASDDNESVIPAADINCPEFSSCEPVIRGPPFFTALAKALSRESLVEFKWLEFVEEDSLTEAVALVHLMNEVAFAKRSGNYSIQLTDLNMRIEDDRSREAKLNRLRWVDLSPMFQCMVPNLSIQPSTLSIDINVDNFEQALAERKATFKTLPQGCTHFVHVLADAHPGNCFLTR